MPSPAGDALYFVLDRPFTAPAGDALAFVFQHPQGLAGVVEDIEGGGLAGRIVYVYSRATGELQGSATSGADGTWTWTSATAGDVSEYFVVAIDPAPEADDYAPSAANRLAPATVV